MQSFLAQCTALMAADMPVFASLFLAGLLGSASHCSMMCAPLAAAQMLRIQEVGGRQSVMIFYHAGRILTYALLGMVAQQAGHWVFSGSFANLAHLMMVLAGGVFVFSALRPAKAHKCCASGRQSLQQRIDQVFSPATAHFLRGQMMGLMPCGMVVAALMLAATMQSAILAAAGMVFFGMATLPALHVGGYAMLKATQKHPRAAAFAGRSVLVVNGLILCAIGMWVPGLN